MAVELKTFAGLKALVQYRRTLDGVRWNNMAAFDSMSMAERYAKECAGENIEDRPWEYRALELPEDWESE